MLFSGYKFAISFDEATVIGTDRYLTLNLHHSSVFFGLSKVAPLGLIRVDERASGEYLKDKVTARLELFNISEKDIVAAATDAGSNVLKAVDLMGIRQQQCFAHGIDLVVRKAIHGTRATAFDVLIFLPEEEAEDEIDEPFSSPEVENTDDDIGDTVLLGDVLKKVRSIARRFRKSPKLMDELRKTTAREDYNGKPLIIKLDCRTRWYSTLLMVERVLEILPALNIVLSHHGTPIDANDARAMEQIASVLSPFKNAILVLCTQKATLSLADKAITLLLDDLLESRTEFAERLRTKLIREIRKRRTILSTALAMLNDPEYDFRLEVTLGLQRPSDSDILDLLADILDAEGEFENGTEQHARPKVGVLYCDSRRSVGQR